MAAPIVIQNSWRRPRMSFTVSLITVNAALETFSRMPGAMSSLHTSSRDTKPSSASANKASGMRAKKTWKEIALA
jgi:hypothetical protein